MTRAVIELEPVTPALLDEIRDTIVKALLPDKIILFGSAACGGDVAAHDVDLYVIKEGIPDVREAARRVEQLFVGRMFALDILVRTPEQVVASLKAGNSFVKEQVFKKGQVLYERRSD